MQQFKISFLLSGLWCLLCFTAPLKAQQPNSGLIRVIPSNQVVLNAADQMRYDAIMADDDALSSWFIELDTFEKHLNGKQLQVKLPDRLDAISFNADYVSSTDDGTFTWHGYTENGSSCRLTQNYLGTIGVISDAENHFDYSIRQISQSKLLCVKHPVSLLQNECSDNGEDEVADEITEERNSCPSNNIRVLVLFSPEAALQVVPQLMAANFIAELNATCSASGMSQSEISFSLANALILPGFIETTDMGHDLRTFYDMPLSHQLRDNNQADLVILLTDDTQEGVNGQARRVAASEANGFCISKLNAALNNFTGSHEIGHLIGARHQRCSTCSTGLFSGCDPLTKHHGFPIGDELRTIMFQNGCAPRVRVGRWSNPDAPFGNNQTGDSDNNNSRVLKKRADDVSCFRSEPPFSTSITNVDIQGPAQICKSSVFAFFTASFNPFQVVMPLTYKWEISLNGVSNWTQIGSNATLPLTSNLVPTLPGGIQAPSFFLRVTITDFGGKKGSDQMEVTMLDCLEGGDDRENVQVATNLVEIFPNPVSRIFTLKSSEPLQHVSIFNADGRCIYQNNTIVNTNTMVIDSENFHEGVYYLRLQNDKSFQTIKFIKL